MVTSSFIIISSEQKEETDSEIADLTRHVFESNSDNAQLTNDLSSVQEELKKTKSSVTLVQVRYHSSVTLVQVRYHSSVTVTMVPVVGYHDYLDAMPNLLSRNKVQYYIIMIKLWLYIDRTQDFLTEPNLLQRFG